MATDHQAAARELRGRLQALAQIARDRQRWPDGGLAKHLPRGFLEKAAAEALAAGHHVLDLAHQQDGELVELTSPTATASPPLAFVPVAAVHPMLSDPGRREALGLFGAARHQHHILGHNRAHTQGGQHADTPEDGVRRPVTAKAAGPGYSRTKQRAVARKMQPKRRRRSRLKNSHHTCPGHYGRGVVDRQNVATSPALAPETTVFTATYFHNHVGEALAAVQEGRTVQIVDSRWRKPLALMVAPDAEVPCRDA